MSDDVYEALARHLDGEGTGGTGVCRAGRAQRRRLGPLRKAGSQEVMALAGSDGCTGCPVFSCVPGFLRGCSETLASREDVDL